MSDIRLPDVDGDELFGELLARHGAPLPPLIFITGYGSIERAIASMKLGAADYVTKPFDLEQLIEKPAACSSLRTTSEADGWLSHRSCAGSRRCCRASRSSDLRPDHRRIRCGQGTGRVRFTASTGARASHSWRSIAAVPRDPARGRAIRLRARCFHWGDPPKHRPLRTGQRRHVVPGRDRRHAAAMQVKLLRAMQERPFTGLAGSRALRSTSASICATHGDLEKWSSEQHFARISSIA